MNCLENPTVGMDVEVRYDSDGLTQALTMEQGCPAFYWYRSYGARGKVLDVDHGEGTVTVKFEPFGIIQAPVVRVTSVYRLVPRYPGPYVCRGARGL